LTFRSFLNPPPTPQESPFPYTTLFRSVDDGIHGPDVVEVGLVARRAVGARLGLGRPREDPRGLRADRGGEPAPLEDREDVTERAVVLVRAGVDIDVHLGGTESRLPHLARDELPPLEREL